MYYVCRQMIVMALSQMQFRQRLFNYYWWLTFWTDRETVFWVSYIVCNGKWSL